MKVRVGQITLLASDGNEYTFNVDRVETATSTSNGAAGSQVDYNLRTADFGKWAIRVSDSVYRIETLPGVTVKFTPDMPLDKV